VIRRPICRRFGTEPKPTGSGPNQGSGRFGYYFGYLTTRVRVVNLGPRTRVPVNIPTFNRAIRDGEVVQVFDLKDGIAMNAAWETVSEMMASINTLTWCCCLCDEADAAGPSGKRKRMKWT